MESKDIIATVISVISLTVSGATYYQSRKVDQLARATAEESKELTKRLNRPWMTLASIGFDGGSHQAKGVKFTFKNSGSSPALDVKICPVVDRRMEDAMGEMSSVEKDSSMDAGTVPQGESATLIMPLTEVAEMRPALRLDREFAYGVTWTYEDVLGNRHRGRQYGRFNPQMMTFTEESADLH